MHLLIAFGLFAACVAAPQRYTTQSLSGPRVILADGYSGGRSGLVGGISGRRLGAGGYDNVNCGPGQVRHIDGSCVEPIVDRSYFVYNAPELPIVRIPPPPIPPPKVDYNVVFVRTPEAPKDPEPIVIPPPQEKTLVYVLSKTGEVIQRVIEAPAVPDQTPEVFYVNYEEGDNPTLPGGFELQNVLASATAQQGQVFEEDPGSGIGGLGVSFGGVGRIGSLGVSGGGLSIGQPSQTYKSP